MDYSCSNFTSKIHYELLDLRVQWLVFPDVGLVLPSERAVLTFVVERHFETLKNSFPWDQIRGRKVVDVGGGSGHMSVSLARVSGLPILVSCGSH
jgi:2-polyprenyl-3-methyl-5-hydroxy-6-metoxy-1,4-benzoquinol methylase